MPVVSLNRFPAVIECGDTARVTLSFGDFPASQSTAVLIFNQRGGAPVTVNGSPTGDAFLFVLTSDTSASMDSGIYSYAVRCTSTATGETQIPADGAGTVQFLPNLASTLSKSTAQQQLDLANAAFAKLIANPFGSTNFNGQTFTKENQGALISIISRLEAKVRAEQERESGLRGDPQSRAIRPFFC